MQFFLDMPQKLLETLFIGKWLFCTSSLALGKYKPASAKAQGALVSAYD